ncbi:Phosphatidylinositol N-acetylglucosaminyltransferase GPI3 subunit [Thecaphora frezii]
MVKAKTDPSAPAGVVRLLDEIEAVEPTSERAAGEASTAQPLVAQLVALLDRCLDLVYQSEQSEELSPSFKYGLDAIRLWASHCSRLVTQPPLADAPTSLRALLFSAKRQRRLANLVWSACHSERTQIATRSKAVIEATIGLIHRIASHTDTNAIANANANALLSYPRDAPFVSDLVARSFAQLERKQAPIILEVLLAKYGSAPFRQQGPAGATYTDSQVYERIVKGLGTVDGGANRRSRLALGFLQARATDLGCQLSRKAATAQKSEQQQQRDQQAEAWQRWVSIWLAPLRGALEDGGERLRSGLASYHLAPLFDMDSRIFGLLLDSLMQPTSDAVDAKSINVEAIFMTLRMGKTQGYCSISDAADFGSEVGPDGTIRALVPSALLKDCILSAASELQISTLSLVIESRTPALPFNSAELEILRTFFPYSLTISNPGARSELRGSFVKMLTRLRASSYALARDAAKITRIAEHERHAEEKVQLGLLQRDLQAVQSFLEWIYALIRQTLHPGASYQSCITALTFLDLILESGIDPRFSQSSAAPAKATDKTLTKNAGMTLAKTKQVYVQDFPFTLDLISPALVQLLFSCAESTYDDIQNRALTMLTRFPAPLPGLADRDTAATRILGKAARLLTSSRDFESAAASRLVQLYKTIYIGKLDWPPISLLALAGFGNGTQDGGEQATTNKHLQLIFHHLNLLAYLLSVAEEGRILEAATTYPVHGTLVTLQELFASVQLGKLSPEDTLSFGRAIESAKRLVDRTWDVTKAVLCNSAPEGSVGSATAEEKANDGTVGLHQPTHESARAMRVADQDGKAEGMEQQEESIAGPKHQIILSYSWRGMKEASALLGALVSSTLRASTKRGDGVEVDTSSLWTRDSIESVGARFNLWLTQVRHRGAFSTIYPAYCDAAAAIVRSGWKEVEALPRKWIQTFLDAVAQPGTMLSITRRSAGIGYAVLALVSAHPNKTDASVLLETVERLIEITQQATSNDETSLPVSAIHALNILRVLVSDGQLSQYMSPFIGQLMELTISKFSSKFWGLRNVSMMLSSSLCIRCFSSRHTNKDTKDARMPIDEFFATYANMDDFLRRTLEEKAADPSNALQGAATPAQDEQAESSVFAVLMLFSWMQAPEVPSATPRYSQRHQTFAALTERCASSPTWKIREMAAKAYAAVTPLTVAPQACVALLQRSSLGRQNQLHGHLLMVQRLLRGPKESDAPSSAFEEGMSALAESLCAGVKTFLVDNRCPATQAAFLEVLQEFVSICRDDFGGLGDRVLSAARPWISQTLATAARDAASLLRTPCGPSLLSICTRISLQSNCRQIGVTDAFLASCCDLVSHPVEDVRLAVLEAVTSDEGAEVKRAASTSATAAKLLAEFGCKVHQTISDASEGIWVRVNAAEVLHILLKGDEVESAGPGLASHLFPSASALVGAITALTKVARTTPIVPLREVLLPYIAGLCAALCSTPDVEASVRQPVVDAWCKTVARCADEYESVQSREAAGQALRTMGRFLFPATPSADLLSKKSADVFAARLASINLLTDDDEDVRIEAAAMIGETIAVSSAAVPLEAVGGSEAKRPSANLEALTRVARSGGASSEVSTDRGWTWMARHYSATSTGTVWTKHVWSQLVPSPLTSDREFEEAFSPSTMLFTEEKPNQFRDPEASIRRAYASVVSGEIEPPSSTFADEVIGRTLSEVRRLSERLRLEATGEQRGDDLKVDLVATHLLATRVVLAFSAVQRSGIVSAVRNQEVSAAADAVVRIVQRLGLDASHIASAEEVAAENGLGKEQAQEQASVQEQGQEQDQAKQSYSIAMVSDFFFPNVGGVEGHIYLVSRALLDLGHKVIVITHAYAPDRVGVRYLSSGLKVYYVPYGVIARQDTLPNFFSLFPMLRSILVRERVEIVHGHQALSSMAHEGILHARTLGLKTVFTDHSLFGFADAASILTNKLLRFVLSDVDAVVAVSHTGKENTTLRAHLDPRKVSVIPNAVVAEHFLPDPSRVHPTKLTIVVLSRLMYRKGIDLLITAIPRLCGRHKDLHFLIGGDGPKRVELEQMRERYMIQDRVELVGTVRQADVRAHLTRGQIFLNTSLTEAFGTGIIEAACAGLFVVSTRVGGVPEVLPDDMIRLARPEEDDVVRAMEDAIAHVRSGRHDPIAYHQALRQMYSWKNVAARLEKVYDTVALEPFPTATERFERYYAGGVVAGKIFCIIVAVDMLFLKILEWFLPVDEIDTPPSLHGRAPGPSGGGGNTRPEKAEEEADAGVGMS